MSARRRAAALSGGILGALVAGVAMTACVVLDVFRTQPSWCPLAVRGGWGDWLRVVGLAAAIGTLAGALGGSVGYFGARIWSVGKARRR